MLLYLPLKEVVCLPICMLTVFKCTACIFFEKFIPGCFIFFMESFLTGIVCSSFYADSLGCSWLIFI